MQQVIYWDSYFYQKLSLHLNFPMQESGMGFSHCACCKHLPLVNTEESPCYPNFNIVAEYF